MVNRIGCTLGLLILVILHISTLSVQGLSNDLRLCSTSELTEGKSNRWYIMSESMVPALRPGDAVLVSKGAPFSLVGVGDIIVFREPVPDGETADVIVSRVIELLSDPHNFRVILTKGDANSGTIPGIDFPIYESDYIGRADCLIPDATSSSHSEADPMINWGDICSNPIIDTLIVEECDALVTAGGYGLTEQGKHVLGCVLGGGTLTIIALELGIDPLMIMSALRSTGEGVGCGSNGGQTDDPLGDTR